MLLRTRVLSLTSQPTNIYTLQCLPATFHVGATGALPRDCSQSDYPSDSGFPDTTPPTVSASVSTAVLMPPNLKLVDVELTVTASDNVTVNPTINIQVLSDEVLLAGDVSYTNGVPSLRATRDNAGDGRVYLIVVTATDEAGNASSTCTTVVVPFSHSPSDIDSVQAQAAAACQ